MCMSAKELYWNCREMRSDGRQDCIVFGACDVAEWGVAYDNDEIYVICLIAEDRLKPVFLDEGLDRLTCRHEFIVALVSNVCYETAPLKSKRIPNARIV